MTTVTNDSAPREVPPPQEENGRLTCPRCSARVLSSGADLFCAACGYEYSLRRFYELGYRLPGSRASESEEPATPSRSPRRARRSPAPRKRAATARA